MKSSVNALFGNAVKRIFLPAFLAAFFAAATVPAGAQAQEKGKIPPAEVKFLGTVGSQPLFQMTFDNPNEEDLYISLKGPDGTVLYSEWSKEKKYLRTFRMEDYPEDTVTFTVTSRKNKQMQVFQVNRSSRVVEDVVVTKLR
jgi:hypothetical protein